ncbi:MAG: porphobilinogen synthase [Gammaproteobacteria bacterium]|nr:porphobilinogen synthase [Gammaproteobacteria bacterium]
MLSRLARLRQTATMRQLLSETHVLAHQLIAPIFMHATLKKKKAISSMPGYFQLTLADLSQEIDELLLAGIRAVMLFGIPAEKDAEGSESWSDVGIVQQTTRFLRKNYPELLVIADLCFCEYTDHGHCGIISFQQVHHDLTLPLLAKQAISLADAGAHWLAPSGMIDGMVQTIREALDQNGHTQTAILSHAAKYQSHFYGPFRAAAEGAPQFGDRASYQMNPANAQEALREVAVDIQEGADLVMIKPALPYLDIIYRVKQAFPTVPLCAYQVSGEFAMIKCAAAAGLVQESAAVFESLLAIKRAGADLIVTYFAKTYAELIRS